MREFLRAQGTLLAFLARAAAAVATGNPAALAGVEQDVNKLHERWHGHA